MIHRLTAMLSLLACGQAAYLRGPQQHTLVAIATTSTTTTTTPLPAATNTTSQAVVYPVPPPAFTSCLNAIKEGTVFPGGQDYNQARRTFNDRTMSNPLAIFYANSTAEVAAAMKCASDSNVKVSPAAGRQGFTGMSVVDGFLVIDVSAMTMVEFDKEALSVKVGPGNSNAMMISAIKNSGIPGAAVPLGTCTWVGVSGFILGGGFGYLGKYYGLACDQLLGLEMVTYDGEIVRANKTHNTDLMWASCGGGGGTFGVVTEFDLKVNILPTKKDEVTAVELFYAPGVESTVKVISALQDWLPNVDRRFGLDGIIMGTGMRGAAVMLVGIFLGTPQEALEGLKSTGMLDNLDTTFAMSPGFSDTATEMPYGARFKTVASMYDVFKETAFYWTAPQYGYTNWPWGPTLPSNPEQNKFLDQLMAGHAPNTPHQLVGGQYYGWWAYSQSRMTGRLEEEGLREIAMTLDKAKDDCVKSNITDLAACGYQIYGHVLGGAYTDKKPDETAFFNRDKLFLFNGEVQIPRLAELKANSEPAIYAKARAYVDDYLSVVSKHEKQSAAYVNYQLPSEDTQVDWQSAYFGENYARLQQIKAKYDPRGGFNKPMTVQGVVEQQ